MNAILSFILCFAMLLSPTGTLPAQPETASTWTVSNLTISVGDESVTLAPEARLTTAFGTEEAQLHFELGSGERTLMPMSGAINKDGVRFTLGTGMRTYTLSNETFMELTGMDEEDAQMLDLFGDFFLSYGKILAMMKDQEKYNQYYDLSWNLMKDMLGAEYVETEVEVEGEMLPAYQIKGELTLAGMLNMLDVAAECGIPELEEFVDVTLEMVNVTSGETIEKFSDLAATVEEEEGMEGVIMEMDCTYTEGDPLYSRMDLNMDVAGQSMTAQAETITHGEDTVALMLMEMNAEDTAMSYAITMDCTGPVTAPTRLELSYDILAENDFSYEYTEDDGSVVDYTSTDNTAMRMTVNAETIDGLKNADVEIIMDIVSTYGYDGDLDTYEETVNMNMAYDERREEDGSITGSYALDVDAMGETVGISFDLNCIEGEVVDYFANTTEQPLSADTSDAGYAALMADFMGAAADGMALAADESVMDLMTMFENLAAGDVKDYDYEEEAYEEDYDEDNENVVYSLEEAAAIFDGTIPNYTAPEGYSLKEIEVDEYSLYATYASEEDEFELCTYAYDSDSTYYSMKDDGSLTAIEGLVVEIEKYGDVVGSASVYGDGREVTFYFSGVDMATAEAVVNGLL